jgi:hypothetical protein
MAAISSCGLSEFHPRDRFPGKSVGAHGLAKHHPKRRYRNPDVALETNTKLSPKIMGKITNPSKSQKDPTIPWLKNG